MAFNRSASARRAAGLAAAALLLVALVAAARSRALAAPSTTPTSTISASLEASADAVPVSGAFGYTAHVRLGEPASYLQARLQVRRPGGQLVYQRTQIANDLPAGRAAFSFSRDLDVLRLRPGAYPAEFSVRATVDGSTETTTVQTSLLVFDPTKPAVPVVLVAKVYGQPMMNAAGRLVVDPATDTKPLADADRIASIVTTDPFSSVTLAVPPVLLEEWRRISTGYTSVDGTSVPATDPTPRAYAETLSDLKAAVDTGRLELLTLGYADPNLSELDSAYLTNDVGPQYEAGVSACFASLETTPSTGTVPAGGSVPPASLAELQARSIGYTIASGGYVRQGKSAVPAGEYPIAGTSLKALVTDVPASRALQSGETSPAVRRVFDRLVTSRASQPFTLSVEVGENRPDATSTVLAATNAFETLSWARLKLGRECVPPKGAHSVATLGAKASPHAPPKFWATVREARREAHALTSALGENDPDSVSAENDSLLAEAAAWSEPGGTWKLADRGLAFASSATKLAKDIFGKVKITAEPVTLSGAKGEVPITIQNGTQKTLSVVIHVRPGGGIKVTTPRMAVVLRPRENFVQIPVDTQAALGGRIEVQVVAGAVLIAHRSVEVRASSLDRLALFGAVFVVLVILLAFVWRRARRARADVDAPDGTPPAEAPRGRYTETDPGTTDEADTQ